MKKTFTLLMLLFVITSAYSAVIRKSYDVTNYAITTADGYQTISFDNMIVTGRTGEPGLPYYAVKLLLPPGHEAVSISFEGTDEVELQGYYKLYPMQYSRPLSDKQKSLFMINSSVYESSAMYPQISTGTLTTHFMNGYAYALSTFTPVQYNPAEGKLSWFQTVTITIETHATQKAEAALMNLTSNPLVKSRNISYAQNPELIAEYSSSSRSLDNYDVLIITPEMFTSAMQSLVNLYKNQGLKTNIFTVQYINSNITGSDPAEKIRNLIIQEYQTYGISQVILGGDVEHVAYRGFYCAAQSSVLYEDNDIPSDLYYSALDGNWNTDGDQMWAEIGEDDLLPDISVGRMSFSNATELASMINKTTKYQSQPVQGELRNHLLAGENLYDNPETWGSDYLELLVGYQNENGYVTSGIPASDPILRMYDEEGQWSPQDLMNAINAGRSFINHAGHANDIYTMKLYNWDITNSNFSGVNGIDHNFPIVYTHGCICGAFDADDCIAERMVCIENFASAFVGNSRYGWFNEGQTEGPSAHLQREFIDALYTDRLNRIGSAHMESKIATAPWVNAPGQWEEGALRWCFYDCNVLGDPAMAVWTNEPINIAANYPATIPTGSSTFDVTVISMGLPASGLTVSAIKNDILIGKGITNQNGLAEVVLDSAINLAGPAQIIVSGYNCLPTVYNTLFTSTIGIEDITISNLNIYPNPADNFINLSIDRNNFIERVRIMDLTGKIIKEFNFNLKQSEVKIPTSDIDPGLYFLDLYTSTQNDVAKIIIQ